MSLSGFIYGQYVSFAAPRQKRKILKTPGLANLTRHHWERSLCDPTDFYKDCYRYFHQQLPPEIKEHRSYFWETRRGFSEDAMHVMWTMLFAEYKPTNFLEIGVYRGQTVTLAGLLAKRNGMPCRVVGISPFTSVGDSHSTYRNDIDYQKDTLAHFAHFKLPQPELLKAYSTDAEALALIRSTPWDMIYIDGNHDYAVAASDWNVCAQSVRKGGVIIMDDAGCTSKYRPPLFASRGLPDPSRLAQEIDRKQFREVLQVGHNRVFEKIA